MRQNKRMWKRRITLNLIVALLAFAVGTLSSRFRLHHDAAPESLVVKSEVPTCPVPGDLQEILNVEYCDLMAEPERYDGRIVRFDAVMLAQSGYEPIWDHVSLREPRCEPELWVHDQFRLTSRTCPAVLQRLDSLLMRDDPSYPRKNLRSGSSANSLVQNGQCSQPYKTITNQSALQSLASSEQHPSTRIIEGAL